MKLYFPTNIPTIFQKYYDTPELSIPFKDAEKIFYYQQYEDPAMRGRQSVNPLNKLGFSIAREKSDKITITELGSRFIAGDYDIGYIFFKSLLKLQFPNPWSNDFSAKYGFDVQPLISTMHLRNKVNSSSEKKGVTQTEFSLFVPSLINYKLIDDYTEKVFKYRKSKNKNKFIIEFAKEFYQINNSIDNQIKNFYEYGDTIMRYFRLTRYFKVSLDSYGADWRIDLEPTRQTEENTISFSEQEKNILETNFSKYSKEKLDNFIYKLRAINLELKERQTKISLINDINKINKIIDNLKNYKIIKKFAPEQFEKINTEALKIINDEIKIKPNYPVDDSGEPIISHAPGNQADIECYYQSFNAICEVTLDTSNFQWILESQPVLRHFQEFETRHTNTINYWLVISPKIHMDTLYHFWTSIKHGYNGQLQKIIPLTTEQFAIVLETFLILIKNNKKFSHTKLEELYREIILKTNSVSGHSAWFSIISQVIEEWEKKVIA